MKNDLLVRTVSAVVLAAVALMAVWVGGFAFRFFAVGISVLVFFEWFRMTQTRSLSTRVWGIGAATLCVVSLLILIGFSEIVFLPVVAGAVIAGLVRRVEGQDLIPSTGILYAGSFGICFVALRDNGNHGAVVLLGLFAIIWFTDIFAYFGGRTIGGPKLAPGISPNKTWSGFFSGLAGGLLAGSVMAALLGIPAFWAIAGISIVLSLAGQLGDLFESALKRRYEVKDSGGLIPGHGGVMDRVDSIIFATFVAYLTQLFIPWSDLIESTGQDPVNRILSSGPNFMS